MSRHRHIQRDIEYDYDDVDSELDYSSNEEDSQNEDLERSPHYGNIHNHSSLEACLRHGVGSHRLNDVEEALLRSGGEYLSEKYKTANNVDIVNTLLQCDLDVDQADALLSSKFYAEANGSAIATGKPAKDNDEDFSNAQLNARKSTPGDMFGFLDLPMDAPAGNTKRFSSPESLPSTKAVSSQEDAFYLLTKQDKPSVSSKVTENGSGFNDVMRAARDCKPRLQPLPASTASKTSTVSDAASFPQAFQFNTPSPDEAATKARISKKAPTNPTSAASTSTLSVAELRDSNITTISTPSTSMSSLFIANASKSSQASMKTLPFKKSLLTSSTSTTSSPTASSPLTDASIDKGSTESVSRQLRALKLKTSTAAYEKEKARRKAHATRLNLVVIGHVDAGKSTLMGHLLHLTGQVSDKVMQKHEREAKKAGKSSFAYAWVLDETEEERQRGVTMDIAVTSFETLHRSVTILDAPGHRDFVPNMICGATQADIGLLVVDATRGEFEMGLENQTREHVVLARGLGLQQLVVVVNKMDQSAWSYARFEEVRAMMAVFLRQVGFKEDAISFVPCSGLTGEHMIERTSAAGFEACPSLIEVIDSISLPERPLDEPFRMILMDVLRTSSGAVVSGRVDTGLISVQETLLIEPLHSTASIKNMEVHGEQVSFVGAGDQVTMTLSNVDGRHVNVGDLLCEEAGILPATVQFQAHLIVLNINVPLTIGYPVILHWKSLNEPAHLSKLISVMDRSTGLVTKKNPRALTKNSTGIVEITLSHPICVAPYANIRQMGRFLLRAGGQSIAVGIVTHITEKR